MADDFGKLSREALARANQISETAIFCSLIIAIIVITIAMIKDVLL